jgi:hypothetical protein
METDYEDVSRQAQGGAGQQTPTQDPELIPDSNAGNQIQQRTSDDGEGREQSASTDQSSDDDSESDEATVAGADDETENSGISNR